jgi:hypothetical protein
MSLQTGLFCRLAMYTGSYSITNLSSARPTPSNSPAAALQKASKQRPPPPGPRTGLRPIRRPQAAGAASSAFGPASAGRRLSAAGPPPPRLPRVGGSTGAAAGVRTSQVQVR